MNGIELPTTRARRGPRLRDLWRDLADAVRGTEMDYTQGSLGRAVLLLSVPMMLEMVLESVFAVVDVYFVSSLGASAVATVGLTESVLTLVYAVSIGLSTGTTALVARRVGEKNPDAAADAAVQAILVGLAASIPFAIAGLWFSKDILALMGADAWCLEHGYRYMVWELGGNVVVMLLFVINAIFRGAGDAAVAMRVLWIANALNIALDPLLIFGWGPVPAFGVEGAAIGNNVGRGVGVLVQLWVLFRGARRIRVTAARMRWQADVAGRLVLTSLGGIGQLVIATSSWIGLVRIAARFGSDVVAGYTIAVRIVVFTMMPAWGLSNAAATLVGQNLGARRPDRAERAAWLTGFATTAFMGLVCLVYIPCSGRLVSLFTSEPAVLRAGADCLRIVSYGYLAYAWGLVMPQSFNGAGDTLTPTKINLACYWLLEIPLAYVLAVRILGSETGVWWAIVIAEVTAGALGIALFRRGTWKQVRV
jgi:putative MATE family efflux protein